MFYFFKEDLASKVSITAFPIEIVSIHFDLRLRYVFQECGGGGKSWFSIMSYS